MNEWMFLIGKLKESYTSVSRQWMFLLSVCEWPRLTFALPLILVPLLLASLPQFIAAMSDRKVEGKDSRTISGGGHLTTMSSFFLSSVPPNLGSTLLYGAHEVVVWLNLIPVPSSPFPTPAASALNNGTAPSLECSWWFAESSMSLR